MPTKLLALTALVLLSPAPALAAAGGCHAVSGSYVNHTIPCTVPALSCAESVVTGGLAGVSVTVVTTFDPATHTFSGTVTNNLENGAILAATIVGTLVNGVGHSVETFTGGTRPCRTASTASAPTRASTASATAATSRSARAG
jgi:hypothetical protein